MAWIDLMNALISFVAACALSPDCSRSLMSCATPPWMRRFRAGRDDRVGQLIDIGLGRLALGPASSSCLMKSSPEVVNPG